MTTTPAQIDLWRRAPTESQRLEFKEAKAQFDFDELCRYCVALANEGGGTLLLGVANKPPRPVVGSRAYPQLVKTAEQLFTKLGFRVDLEEVAHPDGRVVVVHVPARPHGTCYDLEGRYLMRSGSSLVPMSEDRLRRIFAEGQPDWLEEHARSGLDPQDVIELLDTQTWFELARLPYPTHRGAVLERLLAERFIDEVDGQYAVRRLGGLLLARHLDAFPDLARKAARVVVYSGTNKLHTRLDQTLSAGYAVGFQDLVRLVVSQLPQNEAVEDALRRDVKLVPDVVIRELVANALIHQDLAQRGASVMVEVYADRVEVSNPGEPPVPVERFIDGYLSRNERLADVLRRLRICEEKGSGIDRVVQAAEFYQLPAPDFRVGVHRTTVTVYGPRAFSDMDRGDRVRACYQHCALKWVMNERMSNATLRQRFGLGEGKVAIASQIIAATMEAGLIKLDERVGLSRKYARYLPFWA